MSNTFRYGNVQLERILHDKVQIFKKKGAQIDYLKPKYFKKLQDENDNIKIIGKTDLKRVKKKDNCDKLVLTSSVYSNLEESLYFKYKPVESKKKMYFVKGYLSVGEDRYIGLKRKFYYFILLFLLGMAVLVFAYHNDNPFELEFEGTEIRDKDKDKNSFYEYIDVPAYADMRITDSNRELWLVNPEGNTVYFMYRISEDGNTLYQSKAIGNGLMVTVDLYKILDEGTHTLDISIETYDMDTNAVCNGAEQHIEVTVEK